MLDKDVAVGLSQAAFLIFLISLAFGYLVKNSTGVLAFFLATFVPATFGTAVFVFGRGADLFSEIWIVVVALVSSAILIGGLLGAKIRVSTCRSG